MSQYMPYIICVIDTKARGMLQVQNSGNSRAHQQWSRSTCSPKTNTVIPTDDTVAPTDDKASCQWRLLVLLLMYWCEVFMWNLGGKNTKTNDSPTKWQTLPSFVWS